MTELTDTQRARLIRVIVPLALAVVFGLAYYATLPTTLYWGDGIELATTGRVLGVAHPTGYPLYTMMLHCAQTLPLGSVAFRSNLLDAALATGAVVVWYWIALLVLGRIAARREDGWLKGEIARALIAAGCVMIIGASRAFWFHAVTTEVYALNMLFLAVGSLWAFQLAEQFTYRRWAALWLLLGLALAHHRLALMLAPMIVVCAHRGFYDRQTRRYALLLVGPAALLIGLTAYAYLPIRASDNPPMNWGDPDSAGKLAWVMRGGQFAEFNLLQHSPGRPFTPRLYRAWAKARAAHLARWTVSQTGWREGVAPPLKGVVAFLLLVFVGIGSVAWARSDPWIAGGAAGAVGLNLFAVFVYNIADISGYFMPLFAWIALTAALGWTCAVGWLEGRLRAKLPLARWAWLAVAPGMLLINFAGIGYVKSPAPENFGRRLLYNSPPDALILTSGDSAIYSPWYHQTVERFRPDVTVFGSNFITSMWYRDYFGDDKTFVRDFPFQDKVFPSKATNDAAIIGGIVRPQLAAGRPVLATYVDSSFAPFSPEPTVSLLAPNDYNVPEGAWSQYRKEGRRAFSAVYREAAEGGYVPEPPFALRLSLK